jgi:hypothetical protein
MFLGAPVSLVSLDDVGGASVLDVLELVSVSVAGSSVGAGGGDVDSEEDVDLSFELVVLRELGTDPVVLT